MEKANRHHSQHHTTIAPSPETQLETFSSAAKEKNRMFFKIDKSRKLDKIRRDSSFGPNKTSLAFYKVETPIKFESCQQSIFELQNTEHSVQDSEKNGARNINLNLNSKIKQLIGAKKKKMVKSNIIIGKKKPSIDSKKLLNLSIKRSKIDGIKEQAAQASTTNYSTSLGSN
mmetsp:Transcript_21365/g.24551  ORF Transcript_21365/g.24551 Transcript_21365/m.24551 type:complete len:172 (-) Transcript_21365:1014-1529(-)